MAELPPPGTPGTVGYVLERWGDPELRETLTKEEREFALKMEQSAQHFRKQAEEVVKGLTLSFPSFEEITKNLTFPDLRSLNLGIFTSPAETEPVTEAEVNIEVLPPEKKRMKLPAVSVFRYPRRESEVDLRDHGPLVFTGLRSDLIIFFYYHADKRRWFSYDDIRKDGIEHDNVPIRHAIEEINRRVNELTGHKVPLVIEMERVRPNDPRSAFHFRWI